MLFNLVSHMQSLLLCAESFDGIKWASWPSVVIVDSSVTTCDFICICICGLPVTTWDYLWLWMNLLVILKFICIYVLSIYLYELIVILSELCVMHIIFIWMGYVIRDRTIKTWNIWSLCRVLHSAKRYFAECQSKNSRQRGHVAKICAFWD